MWLQPTPVCLLCPTPVQWLRMAAMLGFDYQIALNRMGKGYLCDVLPWLKRHGCQMRDS